MKGVKLAPIFLKNFQSEKQQKGTKKKRGRPKKKDVSKEHQVIVCDIESDTEFYFNEQEEELLRKKFKCFSSEDDSDVTLIDEPTVDINSSSRDVWTNKYKESAFRDRICCQESFSELYLWLTDCKYSQSSSQGSNDSGDEFKSCLLIYGPPGSGKTSLVYAVADELNFKVFEVNCSSKRNGKAITERLKEATESLTINRNKPRQSNENIERNKPPGSTLFQFFKKSENKIDKPASPFFPSSSKKLSQTFGSQSTDFNDSSFSNISFTSDSLLLFDDVDVLFEEDDGFWRAVNTLVESGKPVLLTASHSLEKIRTFVDNIKILKIKPPSNASLVRLLRDIASQENISFPKETTDNIMSYFDGDIRRCLNEIQFHGTQFLKNEIQMKCECDELYSDSLYESGFILDSLLTHSNIVDITQRRNMFMQAFPLEIPDMNWKLFNSIKAEISELSSKIYKHWICKFNFQRTISPFTVNEDTHELLNIRTLIPCNPNTSAITLDYLPYLHQMCVAEDERRQHFIADSRRCKRFFHYFDSISLFITDKLKNVLINRFTSRK